MGSRSNTKYMFALLCLVVSTSTFAKDFIPIDTAIKSSARPKLRHKTFLDQIGGLKDPEFKGKLYSGGSSPSRNKESLGTCSVKYHGSYYLQIYYSYNDGSSSGAMITLGSFKIDLDQLNSQVSSYTQEYRMGPHLRERTISFANNAITRYDDTMTETSCIAEFNADLSHGPDLVNVELPILKYLAALEQITKRNLAGELASEIIRSILMGNQNINSDSKYSTVKSTCVSISNNGVKCRIEIDDTNPDEESKYFLDFIMDQNSQVESALLEQTE